MTVCPKKERERNSSEGSLMSERNCTSGAEMKRACRPAEPDLATHPVAQGASPGVEEVTAAASRFLSLWEHNATFTRSSYTPGSLRLRHKHSVHHSPNMSGQSNPFPLGVGTGGRTS